MGGKRIRLLSAKDPISSWFVQCTRLGRCKLGEPCGTSSLSKCLIYSPPARYSICEDPIEYSRPRCHPQLAALRTAQPMRCDGRHTSPAPACSRGCRRDVFTHAWKGFF